MRASALGLTFFITMACGTAEEGALDLTVNLAPPPNGYQMRSKPKVVQPGQEIYFCDVVEVEAKGDERLIWLNAFESRSSEGTHHMNLLAGYFSVGDAFLGAGSSESLLGRELGQYPCAALGDLMEEQGAQTVYGSQRSHQVGRLPPGVAVPAVVPLVLVMQHHYINTSDEAVLVNGAINFSTVDESEVEHVATGMAGQMEDVELPPKSRKVEGRTCVAERDINIVMITSHSHERSDCFTMNLYDGASETIAPEPFFQNDDWESPPIMFVEEEEWSGHRVHPLSAGDGVHWACHYANDEDRTVRTGESADDEMCIFVAVGYPSVLTVEDVKALVESPSLENADVDAALNPCLIVEAESPWPNANQAMPMDSPPSRCR